MKSSKKLIFFIILFILSINVVSAGETCIYYFYGNGCPYSAKVTPVINELEKTNPDININRFEIYLNQDNLELLKQFFKAYNVPSNKQAVPIVFIADEYLVGDKEIIDNLETEINSNSGASCPSLIRQKPNIMIPLLIILASLPLFIVSFILEKKHKRSKKYKKIRLLYIIAEIMALAILLLIISTSF